MKNKRIKLLIIFLYFLLSLYIPNITLAQLLTDGISEPNILMQYFALFIIFGLPLFGIVLVFMTIYIIVKKTRSKSSDEFSKHLEDSKIIVISIFLTLLIVGGGSILWKQIRELRYLSEENNFLEIKNEELITENERLKQNLSELKYESLME